MCTSRAPGGAHHGDEPARRRAAHDRVVHHHDALALEHLAHRVVLHLHLGVAARLRRLDERAADVVIADQRQLVAAGRDSSANPSAAEFDESGTLNTSSAPGAGHSRRQSPAQRAARAVDRAAEDAAVGPREVDVLEHAAARASVLAKRRSSGRPSRRSRRSRPARPRVRSSRRRCPARTSRRRTRMRRRRSGP